MADVPGPAGTGVADSSNRPENSRGPPAYQQAGPVIRLIHAGDNAHAAGVGSEDSNVRRTFSELVQPVHKCHLGIVRGAENLGGEDRSILVHHHSDPGARPRGPHVIFVIP